MFSCEALQSLHGAAAANPLPALGRLSAYNVLFPGRPRLPYGASIFAITSLLSENILNALLDLRRKGHPIALILVGRQPDRPVPPDVPFYVVRENWTELKALPLTPHVTI